VVAEDAFANLREVSYDCVAFGVTPRSERLFRLATPFAMNARAEAGGFQPDVFPEKVHSRFF
jgi:hypothetical protein